VTSIDIEPEFTTQAEAKLAAQGIGNVTLETADVAGSLERGKSFDVIAVTGSLPLLQQQYHDNLNTGGRLFVISGQLPIMEALLVTRIDAANWTRESLFETSIPPLLHAAQPQRFAL
jgi:protein-L-isoaspartate(D-aspartate) O-methyltransferase